MSVQSVSSGALGITHRDVIQGATCASGVNSLVYTANIPPGNWIVSMNGNLTAPTATTVTDWTVALACSNIAGTIVKSGVVQGMVDIVSTNVDDNMDIPLSFSCPCVASPSEGLFMGVRVQITTANAAPGVFNGIFTWVSV